MIVCGVHLISDQPNTGAVEVEMAVCFCCVMVCMAGAAVIIGHPSVPPTTRANVDADADSSL